MKHFFTLLLAIVTISSCNHKTGSGNIVTETRKTGNFDAVSVAGSFEVTVKTGNATRVEVEADDNIIDLIETRVENNTLKIYAKNRYSFSNVHMKVYVTAPAVSSIKAAASAEVEAVNILTGSKLTFKASSSSDIKAEVDAPDVVSDASSSATISLSGRTQNHQTTASSSADINAFGLLSENTTAHASSSAHIEVFASVNLNAKASSSGSVNYKGAASVSKTVSSSGSVEKSN